ncbi:MULTISPECIES: 3-oxoacyl-[acyl-carrier-protein] reductase [Dictyoglomus]|jgi:3-oxoacyl-[acyl-carrier protein] reductase|uniref:3-oxoacyl-[acyl-carrier-protein] reductase n=1 Tax=Dictyoglomus turgidum (strain DSM 6724 / Z-1310) TaxID=515635 RepID=B8E196_DICTD|nr:MULTISPECIES: 3-oxoacyl-[acyl-carrier-protein] reductase [Dictyoglomus]ACK42224.1 3-oxoacyl-(acyl-carrier-protein) reductase [Dictyoglomus turgidum DSM 6724]HBU32454.1 3-oxoacyl-[acyl-carrier-protein] reductase [Dictyoglomus sp.]
MLKDRVALVTGGSRGIGRAIVLSFAKEGAKVLINYKGNEKAAMETLEEVKKIGGEGEVFKADVSIEEEVDKMFNFVLEKWGRLDILVNNAGITRDNLLIRMKSEEWDQVINTNLKGVFYCTRSAVKIMLKQRYGRIINISSVIGLRGNIGQANYAAAKAGIIGFTKAVAKEVASRGITVNAVAPGFILTDMTEVLSEEMKKKALEEIPMGRFGDPKDVASAVKFLASDEAGYITGVVLSIDGGLSI